MMLNKTIRFNLAYAAAALSITSLIVACGKMATAPTATAPTTQNEQMSGIVFDGRNADQEADEIREIRQKQVDDKKTQLSPMQDSCKYVSDISTRPPQRRVTITLDDGPEPGQTPWILDVLRKYNVKATFFLIGQKAAAHPELVRMIEADGHIIGDHTWTHPNFHDISVAQQTSEFEKNANLLGSYFHPLKLFRYPYGNSTCATNELAHSQGFRLVGWHADSCDWAFNKTGSVPEKDAKICEVAPQNMSNFVGHVVSAVNLRGGGILLMHEIQPNTIRKLDVILEQLSSEGYSFINLDSPEMEPDLR